jgi:SAM-dependent methyltransferase
LQKLIDTPQSLYRTLCEIGCGSGLVLEDLAKRLTQLDAFIGLDLSPDQTQRNRERAVDHRIRFEAGDATVWIPEHASSGTVFLTVAGVLEYLPRHKLSLLFETIGRTLAPSVIAVIEPIPADYDLEKEIDSRPYGPEHSLGHNYPHLLRAAGFDIRFQQVQKLDRSTHLLVVAEYVGRPHSVSSTQGVAS